MGTRSLTHIYETEENQSFPSPALAKLKPLLTIYRQMDGYPSGMGAELADYLAQFKVVNGFDLLNKTSKVANGAGCLAAQLVGFLKDGQTGGIYIYPSASKNCGEDYVYKIFVTTDKIFIQVFEVHGGWEDKPYRLKLLFEGTPAEVAVECKKTD